MAHRVAATLVLTLVLTACGSGPEGERAAGGSAPDVGPIPERPNVLLVTLDTVRYDALGSYGGAAATPALDALATRGVRFVNAYAHTVMTLPSHTAILTGMDPRGHGVHNNIGFRAADGLLTWAERLGAAGWDTGAFIGAFPLDSQFGLAQGFEHYDDRYGAAARDLFSMQERLAGDVVGAARQWLRGREAPWFLWVHVYDAHAPYEPPAPFAERYADDPYAGEVAYVDQALAPLLEDVRASDTLVIAVSDHGEGLGEHGESTHGSFAYESTIKVPLIIAGPGIAAGVAEPSLVAHYDILPTVLEYLRLGSEEMTGTSFLDALRGRPAPPPDRTVYFESLSPNLYWDMAPLRGVVRLPWKYIDLPIAELYDVVADPGETRNLISTRGSVVLELDRALEGLLAEQEGRPQPMAEDPETLQRLRALGYIGGTTSIDDRDDWGPEDDPKNFVGLHDKYLEAETASMRGDPETALRLFDEIIQERADFVHAHLGAAAIEHQRGNIDAAIRRLEAAAATTNRQVLSKLGFYLSEAGRLAQAAEVLEISRDRMPDDVETLAILADVYLRQGRMPEARSTVAAGLRVDPTFADLYVIQGTVAGRLGDLEAARVAFEAALGYDESRADAHDNLGVLAWDTGRREEALAHWRRALEVDGRYAPAARSLGIKLVELNRFAEAVQVLDHLIEIVPPALHAQYQIPQIRDMVGRIKRDHGLR